MSRWRASIGYPVTRLLASDGGAKSRVWMQIAADVLQMPVQLLAGHPGSCLGAALVAAVGVCGEGWVGVERFVRPAGVVEPRSVRCVAYDDGYARYRQAYLALQPLMATGRAPVCTLVPK